MKTTESLEKQLDRYFAEVTDEQLLRDLEKAEFSFYNTIGRVICASVRYADLNLPAIPVASADYSEPISSTLASAGNNEEMLMAA